MIAGSLPVWGVPVVKVQVLFEVVMVEMVVTTMMMVVTVVVMVVVVEVVVVVVVVVAVVDMMTFQIDCCYWSIQDGKVDHRTLLRP